MLKGIKQELNVVASIQISLIIHVHVLVCFPTWKVFMKYWTTSVLWAFCVKCAKHVLHRGQGQRQVVTLEPQSRECHSRDQRGRTYPLIPTYGEDPIEPGGWVSALAQGQVRAYLAEGVGRKLCWEQSACRPRQRNNLVRRVGCQGHGKRPEYELLCFLWPPARPTQFNWLGGGIRLYPSITPHRCTWFILYYHKCERHC